MSIMDYVALAVAASLGSLFLYEFLRRNMPYWRMQMDSIRQELNTPPDPRPMPSWKTSEYTISRDGKTRTYSSLEAMPPEDRKHFLEAKEALEEARRSCLDNNPFFKRDEVESVFKTKTGKVVPGKPQQPQPKYNRNLN